MFLNKFICFIGEEAKTENFIKYFRYSVIIKDLLCEEFPMGVYSRTITNRGICITRGSHSVIIIKAVSYTHLTLPTKRIV